MAPLPLALAAISVEGRCRERNPADIAIFGEERNRLISRFAVPDLGQSLLSTALTEGAAQETATLHTTAGDRRFSIGMWRQRGGDKIRLLAGFSAQSTPVSPLSPGQAAGLPGVELIGHELRSPIAAIMGLAEHLRCPPEGLADSALTRHASDIVAASWRLMRLADDLAALTAIPAERPPIRVAEVDAARLLRRLLRLSAPLADARAVTIDTSGVSQPGAGPMVLSDEGALWSAIDNLLRLGLANIGPGGTLRLGLQAGTGLTVIFAGEGEAASPAPAAETEVSLAIAREMANAAGARLQIDFGPRFTMRLAFPAARCIDPA